jgi:hypothetical protein
MMKVPSAGVSGLIIQISENRCRQVLTNLPLAVVSDSSLIKEADLSSNRAPIMDNALGLRR